MFSTILLSSSNWADLLVFRPPPVEYLEQLLLRIIIFTATSARHRSGKCSNINDFDGSQGGPKVEWSGANIRKCLASKLDFYFMRSCRLSIKPALSLLKGTVVVISLVSQQQARQLDNGCDGWKRWTPRARIIRSREVNLRRENFEKTFSKVMKYCSWDESSITSSLPAFRSFSSPFQYCLLEMFPFAIESRNAAVSNI